ncbi:MAG: GspH/FimT family pseudopilin [Pseudomonadota bacterium]
MKKSTQTGFTLYELLITTLVVGVLLSIGVPSFSSFTQNSRMAASVNDLLGSFQVARSEAARAKDNISICASANSTTANPTCGGQYEDGWIVFQDTNGDVQLDAGEVLIRSHPALPDEITITAAGQGDYFSYGPTGVGRGQIGALPPTTSAIFCDDRGNVAKSDGGNAATGGNSAARVLRVLPIGRATVLRTVNQVTDQGGCP